MIKFIKKLLGLKSNECSSKTDYSAQAPYKIEPPVVKPTVVDLKSAVTEGKTKGGNGAVKAVKSNKPKAKAPAKPKAAKPKAAKPSKQVKPLNKAKKANAPAKAKAKK